MRKSFLSGLAVVLASFLVVSCSKDDNSSSNEVEERNETKENEENNPSAEDKRPFVYKALVEDVTGSWCPPCLYMIEAIREAKNSTTPLKERFAVVAIHDSGGRYDPMEIRGSDAILRHLTTLPSNDSEFPFHWSYPWLRLNRDQELFKSNAAQHIFERLEKNLTSPIGIKISSKLTETGGTVSVSFKTAENGLKDLKYNVFITEDNITYYQAGSGDYNFRHDDVLRAFYGDGSGNALETLTVGKEVTKADLNFSYNLMSREKLANVKVVVFVTNKNKAVVNAQEAKANETKDYQYAE
ncbi:Omp28-related outer membrane protein [Capnocytophaga stomatis]|uniref:Omp28-related outer membrane protein n=1 Tax=Capnocytophaga stomatis TaxID=1848904 RepID=UPI00385E6DE7